MTMIEMDNVMLSSTPSVGTPYRGLTHLTQRHNGRLALVQDLIRMGYNGDRLIKEAKTAWDFVVADEPRV